jgi:GTP-binding protein LepA
MIQDNIRNFAIIAHIDHGKSTLADRLLEMTGTVAMRDMSNQLLDSNPIERERGITIKLAPVRMEWKSKNVSYILNLIDTPGHVDFSYEVSRSLAACEGALLVVDATQGVQAQTLAHLTQARKHNLKIIPLINKIDMPNARVSEVRSELVSLGFTNEEMIEISAKTGENVDKVLEAVVERIPAPQGLSQEPLRALVFSSQYDAHKGVVVFVRVVDGQLFLTPQTHIRFMISGAEVSPIEVGYFNPKMLPSPSLETGEVGYIATGLKDIRFAKVGDTITTTNLKTVGVSFRANPDSIGRSEKSRDGKISHSANASFEMTNRNSLNNKTVEPLPGYKEPKPMVFLGLFPLAADEFTEAREAMEKLRLSDSAFTFRPIASAALGNGFHCGFLGLLHAEVVQERILREFGMTMIATAPSVEYRLKLKPGVNPSKAGLSRGLENNLNEEADNYYSIQSASEYPDPTLIDEVKEPIMQVLLFSPSKYVGAIMQLAQEKRGEYIDMKYLGIHEGDSQYSDNTINAQVEMTYLIPLSEMIIDFFDRLKSVTEGYASLDYDFFEYQTVKVAKVDLLLNHEKVDALSFLVVESQAQRRSREIVEKLATVIPRQQFSIPVQGAVGGTIIARADIKPFRKDVIAKLYGGDRTRKDKLLKKQKKGKAKMKMIGRVEIPQSAFFEVLKRE